MQGGHGYGGYGCGGYGYDAGGYSSAGGYGYDTGGGYNSTGGYGYDAVGYYSNGYPSAPGCEDPLATGGRRAHDLPAPLNGLEFQPSEMCPNNYVIFDQTRTKSRVMFHPSLVNKLGGSSGCHGGGACNGDALDAAGKDAYRDPSNNIDDDSYSVRQKEAMEDIDALLSLEDGDEDDVVSTGRTPEYRDGSSPDSMCSSSKPCKDRMKKMMRTLKGIIPGGNHMDTPAVLDEAVRYLKSLKLEAKKLAVRGSDS